MGLEPWNLDRSSSHMHPEAAASAPAAHRSTPATHVHQRRGCWGLKVHLRDAEAALFHTQKIMPAVICRGLIDAAVGMDAYPAAGRHAVCAGHLKAHADTCSVTRWVCVWSMSSSDTPELSLVRWMKSHQPASGECTCSVNGALLPGRGQLPLVVGGKQHGSGGPAQPNTRSHQGGTL